MGNPYLDITIRPAPRVDESHAAGEPHIEIDSLPLRVAGRGDWKGYAYANADGSITLRLDDEKRPEEWVEVVLKSAEVFGLLCAGTDAYFANVRALAEGKGADNGNPL